MIKITKKRVVLFLLFIFPLICFLILSTGQNNFKRLPIVSENIMDISLFENSKGISFKNNISIVCFLGSKIDKNKSGFFNLNEKIYKKFIGFNNFQIVAIYPQEAQAAADALKKEISAFTDMVKWQFVPASKEEINTMYLSLKDGNTLSNLYTPTAYLLDKNGNHRGRTDNKEKANRKFFGYNTNSVSELKTVFKEDINVLYYEYYAAFKNRNDNKAEREN
jgi:hypothetical protein